MATTSDARTFYRHVQTGDRGYLYVENGKQRIRRDTGVGTFPFDPHEWIIERESRPLTPFVLAQTAFEADKAVCRGLGMHKEATRQWLNLSDEERIEWTKHGPPGVNNERRDLWEAIMGALRKYTA